MTTPRHNAKPDYVRYQTPKPPKVDPAGLRKRLGLTKRAFAHLVGASEATVCKWEQGIGPAAAHAIIMAVITEALDRNPKALAVIDCAISKDGEETSLAWLLRDLFASWKP